MISIFLSFIHMPYFLTSVIQLSSCVVILSIIKYVFITQFVLTYWLMITRTCSNISHVYAANPMVGAAELSIINEPAWYTEPFRVV
ncbi:hypothetical protein Hdeb2414_s0011g00375571 [Helianthus debilis subsp. tardiflorus]